MLARHLTFALVLLVFAGAAQAQSKTLESIASLLASTRAADLAQAGYRVATEKISEAAPLIRERLKCPLPGTDQEQSRARMNLVDALLENGTVLEPNEVAALAKARTNRAAILLMTEAEPMRHEALLASFLESDFGRITWRAAAGQLTRVKSKKVAPVMLDGLALDVRISVVEPDDLGGRMGGRSHGTARGHGSVRELEGFPPAAIYLLEDSEKEGSRRIGGDCYPAFVIRKILESGRGFGTSISRVEDDVLRLAFLKSLLGDRFPAGIEAKRSIEIRYESDADFRSAAAQERDGCVDRFWSLVRSCIDLDLLTRERARNLRPSVVLEIDDCRNEPREALPTIAAPADILPSWLRNDEE